MYFFALSQAPAAAAVALVKELSGHKALSLLDQNTYPELVALLTEALEMV